MFLSFFWAAPSADATTLSVGFNQPYATIGDAILAAADGDTIEIQPGTYVEDLVVPKALTFVGVGGSGQVTVQSAGGAAVVDLLADTTFTGLTVEAAGANGFAITDAAVTRTELSDVAVSGANDGVHALFGELDVVASTFSANQRGVYVDDLPAVTLAQCSFTDNLGGGVYVHRGDDAAKVAILDNTFLRNQAPGYFGNGGGLYLYTALAHADLGDIIVQGNFFGGNVTAGDGGGAFIGNRQPSSGDSVQVAILDNTFVENRAGGHGGGLMVDGALGIPGLPLVARVYDNTFLANRAAAGSALFVEKRVRARLYNDLIAYSTGGQAYYQHDTDGDRDHLLFFANQNDLGGDVHVTDLGPNVIWGSDPLFTAYSEDGDFTNDDLTLLPGSPALDAGDPRWFDADGSVSDIGATP